MTKLPYTSCQIDIAFGILSGRLDPEVFGFNTAQDLHGDLVSAMDGGRGNPGPNAHRRKAEEILGWLIAHRE